MSARPSTRTRSSDAAAPAPGLRDVALCRSAVWEALALGFRPPTEETRGRLTSRTGAGALADAAAALDGRAGGELATAVLALAAGAPALAGLRAQYDRLFGHTARGAVPPYETEYGEDAPWAPPREMSDLTAFFRAFGLVLSPAARERPDHLACECEFMLALTRREAYALERGDAEALETIRRAARLFLREHLGRWAPAVGRKLGRDDPAGFYGALGGLCARFVTAECRRAGVAAGPEFVSLRPATSADVPAACGAPAAPCER